MTEPVQTLPDGPLDLVGDIHGECEALERLLDRLGYDLDGQRPDRQARHLVFLGDLGDRGPDSPGVVRRVRALVEDGVASCVLGNHELNAIRGFRKQGNGWIMGHRDTYPLRVGSEITEAPFTSVDATTEEAAGFLDFFRRLPLALARDDLRVVHACWDQEALEAVGSQRPFCEQADGFDAVVRARLEAEGVFARARAQRAAWGELMDPSLRPEGPLPDVQQVDQARQLGNPVKVLTSGLEVPVSPDAFKFKGGRWRLLRRDAWWARYVETVPVVVGHYWRRRDPETGPGGNLLTDHDPCAWFGARANVFCVDYSVGRRFFERATAGSRGAPWLGALAALRWPERDLVFDDREAPVTTVGFGG